MADRYWVGGSGTWDATTTTNWSATSGGAGGASAPTSADNVFFNSLSNATGYTVTVGTDAVCNDLTAAGPLTGNVTFSLSATSVINCYGSFTLPATGLTWSGTGGASTFFRATTTGKTITTNGIAITTQITFDGVGGGWTLGSALTTATNTILLNNGAVNTGNFNVTTGTINNSAGTGTRSFSFGSSTISCNTNFNFGGTTGFTFNAGTSTIICSGTNPTFNGNGNTFYNVSFTNASAGTTTITGANTFNNLSQTSRGTTGVRGFSIGANQTVSGTLTLGAANTSIRRVQVVSDTIGTQRTITLNGTLATLADVDFRDIATAGTVGTWTGTRLGNGLNNSGITFDAAKDVYWNFAAGGTWVGTAWALTSGGTPAANNFPLAQDKAIIEDTGLNTGASVGLSGGSFWIGELNISTRTLPMTFTSSTLSGIIYKNLTLSSAVTMTGTVAWQFVGQGTTQILDTNTATFVPPITIDSPSGTLQLAENTTCSALVTLTSGTLDLNNNVLTCNIFSSNNSNTRAITFGTGNITLTGDSTTIGNFGTATNFSYTGTPTINATYSGSTGTRVITTATALNNGTEANSLSFNISAGSDIITFSNQGVKKNLNFTGFSGTLANTNHFIYGNLIISSGMTLSAGTSPINFVATSGTQQITTNGNTLDFPILQDGVGGTVQLQDNLTMGSTRTFTLANGTLDLSSGNRTLSCGSFNANNSNTRSIAFGTGNITVTGNNATVFSMTNATNFTYSGTPTVNLNYAGSTGTRIAQFGTGGSETNALNVNITAGTDSFNLAGVSYFRNINFTGFTGTLVTNAFTRNIYGNLTISSGMTVASAAGEFRFVATSGTQLITTNGNTTIDFPITQNGVGGTVQLQDALTMGATRALTINNGTFDTNGQTITGPTEVTLDTGTIGLKSAFNLPITQTSGDVTLFANTSTTTYTLTAGTLNLNGFNLTASTQFSTSNTNVRSINFASPGEIILSGSGTVWNAVTATNLTTSGSGGVSLTSSSAKTFDGGGASYRTISQDGVGALTITGANTFANIANTVQPTIVTFPAGVTTSVNNFALSGTAGNLVTINSSIPGTQFTLAQV